MPDAPNPLQPINRTRYDLQSALRRHSQDGDKMTTLTLQSFAPLHILVVDDDPMITEILGAHYAALGFSIEAVSDGQAALRAMELRLPDIVLCDRLMPVLSGADLLQMVRDRGPVWQALAFVFLTSMTDRRDRYAMMPLHPDGYLYKPIDFDKADQVLAEILAQRQARPSSDT